MGLQDFHPDPDKMQKGIEGLLQGLRHAFLTSLVGIGSAIAIKTIALYQMRNADEDPGMKAITKTDDILNSIKIALSSTQGGTVFTQLQALEKNIASSNTQLVQEISAFSDRIAEKCSLLLVEALKEVVRDYNAKINEQFGENFVKLNEAVLEINRWQEQYRQQMDELATEFRIAADSVEQSRGALASASESLMTIEDQSESLVSIAKTLDPLLHSLNNQLDIFRQLRQQALDAFPHIEKRLNELTTGFSKTVQQALDDSQESMKLQRTALTTHVKEIRDTVQTVTLQLSEIIDQFLDTNEALQKTVKDIPENLAQRLESALQFQPQQFVEIIEEINRGLESRLKQTTNINSIITSLRGTADQLHGTTEQLEAKIQNSNKKWIS
jgi:ABC-type transporter Mla subunit MlaD